MPEQPIPTHLILGFLGVGKTTAIRHLLSQRPEGERWAVLVNEFGEVGIDGALLAQDGIAVKEVPGGCMCCVAGLPMQMGLNMLIAREKPDRLLVEPTGLGHPSKILDTLTGEFYRDILALQSVVCLVDPRRLEEPKVMANVQFQDQVAAADVLVANKTDLCSPEQLSAFMAWARNQEPAKHRIEQIQEGQLDLGWLLGEAGQRPVSHPHAHHHHAEKPPVAPPSLSDQPWQRVANRGDGHYSLGWRLAPGYQLNHNGLLDFCYQGDWLRCKGVVRTDKGWLALNHADHVLSAQGAEPAMESRIEIIADHPLDDEALDQSLRHLVVTAPESAAR